jgi:hypothetical protein
MGIQATGGAALQVGYRACSASALITCLGKGVLMTAPPSAAQVMQADLHALNGDMVAFVAHRLEPSRPLDWRGHVLTEAHDNLKPTSQVHCWRSPIR